MKKIVVGLTGGLGSGKSTALEMFKQAGVTTVCCDTLAHEALLKTSSVYEGVVANFGRRILNRRGEIRRDVLGARVFENPALRLKLERLIHPYVRWQVEKAIQKSKTRVVVVDIPLLYEVKRMRKYDPIIVVYAPLPVRLKRLEKKGISRQEALLRMKAQISLEKKASQADVVFYNTTKQNLKEQIHQFLKSLNSKVARKRA